MNDYKHIKVIRKSATCPEIGSTLMACHLVWHILPVFACGWMGGRDGG